MQKSKEHIRQCFLYCYKLEHNASEAKRKICYMYMYKDALSTKTEFRWFESIRNGVFLLEDKQKSGRNRFK